jgi:hypothetical protein
MLVHADRVQVGPGEAPLFPPLHPDVEAADPIGEQRRELLPQRSPPLLYFLDALPRLLDALHALPRLLNALRRRVSLTRCAAASP